MHDPAKQFDQVLRSVKTGNARNRTSLANAIAVMLAATATLGTLAGLLA